MSKTLYIVTFTNNDMSSSFCTFNYSLLMNLSYMSPELSELLDLDAESSTEIRIKNYTGSLEDVSAESLEKYLISYKEDYDFPEEGMNEELNSFIAKFVHSDN